MARVRQNGESSLINSVISNSSAPRVVHRGPPRHRLKQQPRNSRRVFLTCSNLQIAAGQGHWAPAQSVPIRSPRPQASAEREFIDYKTRMITEEDPLRGGCGGCCSIRISVSLTHYTFLKKGDGGANTPICTITPPPGFSFLKRPNAVRIRGVPLSARRVPHPSARAMLAVHSKAENNRTSCLLLTAG